MPGLPGQAQRVRTLVSAQIQGVVCDLGAACRNGYSHGPGVDGPLQHPADRKICRERQRCLCPERHQRRLRGQPGNGSLGSDVGPKGGNIFRTREPIHEDGFFALLLRFLNFTSHTEFSAQPSLPRASQKLPDFPKYLVRERPGPLCRLPKLKSAHSSAGRTTPPQATWSFWPNGIEPSGRRPGIGRGGTPSQTTCLKTCTPRASSRCSR